jgi:4-alpha-glucanotransferase
LIAIAATRGVAAIGLNPLHALFPDNAEAASPYSPNSRLYLNPLYIDVDAIDEFPGAAVLGLDDDIALLRTTDFVAYRDVARVKLAALHLSHERFRDEASAARRADFENFRREHGETLLRFACFEVLRRQYAPMPWPQWPEEWRQPHKDNLEAFRRAHEIDCEFQEFMQWVADRQLAACQQAAHHHGMPIGLYTDLAVGIDRHGAGAWVEQEVMLANVSIGAPPDALNPRGQDWGLLPFNPQALPANDFVAERRLMGAVMRHAGAVRLDHVLGLRRLFLIPDGGDGGAYVHFPFAPLLEVIAQESNRYHCVVIGEDLGTVPDNFREVMAHRGLWGCRVMVFERDHEGRFLPPENYPAGALATFATHDMASFRGWLEGHDLRVKRAIGLDPGESDEERARAHAALREALARWAPAHAPDDIASVAAFLAATPSRLVVMSLDDVLGVREQINIPGTVDQHPNWRRKLPVAIEKLESHEILQRVAQAFKDAGRSFTGR